MSFEYKNSPLDQTLAEAFGIDDGSYRASKNTTTSNTSTTFPNLIPNLNTNNTNGSFVTPTIPSLTDLNQGNAAQNVSAFDVNGYFASAAQSASNNNTASAATGTPNNGTSATNTTVANAATGTASKVIDTAVDVGKTTINAASSASSSSGTSNAQTTDSTANNDAVFSRMAANRQNGVVETSSNSNASQNPSTSSENTGNANATTYTVKEGDNLSTILKEQTGDGSYENYMRVAKENGIDDPNLIQVGQEITINPSGSTNSGSQSADVNSASNGASGIIPTETNSNTGFQATSGGTSDMQQIQFLDANLYTEVKADEHEEFMYDSEADTSLNAIKKIIEKADDLKAATSSLESALETLATGVYANKTEVKKKFDSTIKEMENRNNQIADCINEWLEGVKAFYESQVESDQELLNDLNVINDYLDDGSFSDWNM